MMLSACAATRLALGPSIKYTISYCSADKEPVNIDKVKYDQRWVKSGGMILGYWKHTSGDILLFPPPPIPKQIYIHWFNYRQQVFYEATVPLKDNAAEIMQQLPPHPWEGDPYLTAGVLPDGSAVVWVSNGNWVKYSLWVEVGRAKGRRVAGDVENFRAQTEYLKRRGDI
jgi:hypothetical protein